MKWEIATGVKVGNFHGECPIQETGRQVTVHFALGVYRILLPRIKNVCCRHSIAGFLYIMDEKHKA